MSSDAPEPKGPVLVVGAGLLGTSIGLALRRRGVDVALTDLSAENVRIATGLGAANLDADVLEEQPPTLVVVAVPPDHLAEQIAEALTTHRRRGHRRGQREGRPVGRRTPPGAGGGPGPLRGRPPDGRQRALRAVRRLRRPVRRPALGGDAPRHRRPGRGRRRDRARGGLRRDAGAVHPRRARRGRRPHLAPAAPAGGPGGRPDDRRAAQPPGAVRAGGPRRHEDRGRRPGALAADRRRQQHRAQHPAPRRP